MAFTTFIFLTSNAGISNVSIHTTKVKRHTSATCHQLMATAAVEIK